MDKSILFTPGKIDPLALRNRTIRATAFESIYPGNAPSEQLFNYHTSVAVEGVGMTNIAYAAVMQSGLSFERQLWMRPGIIPGLRKLTSAIYKEEAAASIQLGYYDNMSHRRICGYTPISASSGFNLYFPTVIRDIRQSEIASMVRAYSEAIRLAREASMDAVEIHAGHGYLISRFLSPYINHRKNEYGRGLGNRMRFMRMCMEEVVKAAGSDMAVTVKANMRDGFKGGLEIDECPEVARTFQDQCGAHALVLSDRFVSRAPMYVIRGEIPIRTMVYYMPRGHLPIGVRMVGKCMIPSEPFKEAYFLGDALKLRKTSHLPPIYVGGLVSRGKIEEVLNDGFEFIAMARALVNEPGFVSRVEKGEHVRYDCGHSNYCIACMYSEDMVCRKNVKGLPKCIMHEVKRLEYK